jgi:shikimate dehydrogenase|tara:strand:- start:135 stop:1004 length:870 start_codon:yes stop_codon:yes gene_type:complete
MILTGKAKLAGVLGWPVAHSLSPRLHGFWLSRHGLDGAYLPLPVAPEKFASAVKSLRDLGFQGANVTLPHKQAAYQLCTKLSQRAQRIGAVNTLFFRHGRIEGDNSDGFGFFENLSQAAPQWDPMAGPAVVLGAGGAARALLVALLDAGVPEIRLLNRTRERAQTLATALSSGLGPPSSGCTSRLVVDDWARAADCLADANLLVNSTQLGMQGQDPLTLDLSRLPQKALVNDIVYAPLETELLKAAKARGNPVVDGLGMLLHQARPGFAGWYGLEPEVNQGLRDFLLAG